MKKIVMFFVVFGLITMILSGNSLASWSFDISDSNDDGTYSLTFLKSADDDIIINSFSLGFGYDQSEVLLPNVANVSFAAPSGYMALGAPVVSLGQVTNISAMSFGSNIENGTTIATFDFNIISTLQNQDGIPELFFQNWFSDGSTVGNFGGTFSDVTLDYTALLENAHLTYGDYVDKGNPVPLPSAFLLFSGGLAGLLGVRRRIRN